MLWLRFFRPCLARRDPRGYPTYGRDVTTPPTIKIYRERVRKKKKDGFPLPDRLKDKLRGNDKKRKSMGKMPMGHMDGTSMLRKTTAGGADVSGRHLSSSFFSSLHRLDILCWILSVHLFSQPRAIVLHVRDFLQIFTISYKNSRGFIIFRGDNRRWLG